MKLAKFWVRETGQATTADGEDFELSVRGWSNESLDAARASAREAIKRIAAVFVSGQRPKSQYTYGDRALAEPILREFTDGGDGPMAIVTRNRYGADVLNTRDLMFVDVDSEAESRATLSKIERVALDNQLAVRVYRTAAGYRVLILNRRFKAGSPESESILAQFGSDPLYVKLCKIQDSFRARLTPKPWRCGLRMLKVGFPFTGPYDEERFQEWKAQYDKKCTPYATCKFLASHGGFDIEPAFKELVELHDQHTKASSSLPLA